MVTKPTGKQRPWSLVKAAGIGVIIGAAYIVWDMFAGEAAAQSLAATIGGFLGVSAVCVIFSVGFASMYNAANREQQMRDVVNQKKET